MPESHEKYDVCVVGSCIADFIRWVEPQNVAGAQTI